ncbi:MAG: putative nucleotidyltransferase [Mucilaginibacter sp.]|nr:putative nucleotidyltransferase [Mucilaginibacter sp.]
MQNIIKADISTIQQIMREHSVVSAFAFGSVLSDKMHPESDIDFLITFKQGMDYQEYGNNYFKLMYALQDFFKRDVDLVAAETVTNPYLLQSIDNNKFQVL